MYHHMQSLLPLLLLSLLRVHAYDVAKCYWAKTQQLPSNSDSSNSYIPCGDVSDGAQSCCRVGHNCLEANACYAPEAGMVYTAGCTDSDYASISCPSKCHTSAYWVGHSYCNGTSSEWSCCTNQYGDSRNKELFPFSNKQQCWCPEENAMIAFNAPERIPSVAYLDLSHPGSISYFPGHNPSTTSGVPSTTTSVATTSSDTVSSTSATTSTSQKTQSASGSSSHINSPASKTANTASGSAAPNTPDPGSTISPLSASSNPSSDPGLPIGAKVGIGVGVGAGAIILAVLLWLVLRLLRKRRQSPPPPIEDQIRPKSFGSYAPMSEAMNPSSANSDLRSPAWSGHKSELPADGNAVLSPTIPSTMSMAPSSMAEVEGSTPRQSLQTVQSQSQLPRQSAQSQLGYDANGMRQYIPYSLARGRSVQDIHEMPG